VTAHNMRYFEEGHYDERPERRIQLMRFVSFLNEFWTTKKYSLHTRVVIGSIPIAPTTHSIVFSY